jgi:hypothetical protein
MHILKGNVFTLELHSYSIIHKNSLNFYLDFIHFVLLSIPGNCCSRKSMECNER